MQIKKIKLSKSLLFTSLAAVALLGATQPVSAEMYTSRNFGWSGDDWSGDDWSGDDWSGDGLSKYDRSGVGLSQYGWSKYGWSSDKEDWPEDDWSEDDWSNDYWSKYGWSSNKEDWPEDWPEDDWSSDKKDETEDKTRPPYGEALGTGYEKRDDWGGPGTVATDPYTPPYGGALGTGYEKRDDWGGPGHKPKNEQSPNPSHIPEPPQIEWPQWNGFDGLSSGPSGWGRSEDTPHSPSGPRIPEGNIPPGLPQAPETPRTDEDDEYQKGFSDGLKAKKSGRGIDFAGFKYDGWSVEYKKGYMAAFSTP
ncbi:TPA: lysis inhibitor protein [Streptococcus pyogenes]|uniref:Sic n=1 Tax=Streptococcus pyogenes TaxID=1314 RepID=Q83U26_STRPY|nr:lysis inhibitor protein [Streptococcus pyogenes]AAP31320.1 Sic [Streptococcus pyogenes]AAP31329.1 Sic [Streptococcus pyogenes]SUO49418.1 sic family protein [Streptococcus pyogenes]VGR17335.1 sic family protein [Streptococcus pyogenes]VGR19773.1 sic family protein [Streptococcus pyogenes]